MVNDDTLEVAGLIRAHKARLIRNAIVVLMLVLVLFGLKALLAGVALRVAAAAFALCAAALAFYYNRTGAVNVVLTLLLSSFWIWIVVDVVTTGSAQQANFGWFPILVFLGGLLGGRRHCLSWLGVSAFTVLVLWGLQWLGQDLAPLVAEEDKGLHGRIHVLTQLLVMGAIVLSFVEMTTRYEQKLDAQVASLHREAELRRRAERVAVQSDRSKTVFLGNMSHEIRTPLNSIIGFSSRLVKRSCLTDPKDEDAVRCILRNGKVLLTLVNELLELADIESSSLEYSDQPFSLSERARDCIVAIEPTARSYGLHLRTGHLDNVEMKADIARVDQIICNLLFFCIGQTREGAVEVSVSRVPEAGIAGARIQVSDSSNGIAEEQLEGLLERHYQVVQNTNRELPISALTLVLTAKLVALHGGTMGVFSEPGQGTRFDVWLPLVASGAEHV